MKNLFAVILITLLGLSLRLHQVATRELWYDEAYTAEIINNTYANIYILSESDVHPPLYYILLKSWTFFGNSELMLRIPSVFFGTALIPLVYFLGVFMTRNATNSIFASLVIAVNPFLITYSKEARSYSLLAFLTVITFFFFIKAYRNKIYFPISVLLPLLFLTHYITIFIIMLFVGILLVKDKKSFPYFIPIMLAILLWLPIIINSSSNAGLKWIPKFYLDRIPQSIHAFTLGIDSSTGNLPTPLNPFTIQTQTLTLLIFFGFVILVVLSKPSKEEKLLLICGVSPIVLIALTSIFLRNNLFVERFMIGYGTLIIIYSVFALRNKFLFMTLPYIALSLFITLKYRTVNGNYKELGSYQSDKLMVMGNATDFINVKYYSNKIKLQDGDWSEWGIIKDSDIFDKQDANKNFYLVTRGPIEGFIAHAQMKEFYFYEWKVN